MQSQFRWICCWPCFRWAIRSYSWGRILNDDWTKIVNNCQTIVITLHRFKVIKYYWEARDQRTKSVLLVLPPDTTQNNLTSIIHHLQTCHFLWFFILCATEFQGAHLTCSHVNLSAFLKHHSKYLQVNEKIELCGVARAFVQISENGPRSKKLGHPWSKPNLKALVDLRFTDERNAVAFVLVQKKRSLFSFVNAVTGAHGEAV